MTTEHKSLLSLNQQSKKALSLLSSYLSHVILLIIQKVNCFKKQSLFSSTDKDGDEQFYSGLSLNLVSDQPVDQLACCFHYSASFSHVHTSYCIGMPFTSRTTRREFATVPGVFLTSFFARCLGRMLTSHQFPPQMDAHNAEH